MGRKLTCSAMGGHGCPALSGCSGDPHKMRRKSRSRSRGRHGFYGMDGEVDVHRGHGRHGFHGRHGHHGLYGGHCGQGFGCPAIRYWKSSQNAMSTSSDSSDSSSDSETENKKKSDKKKSKKCKKHLKKWQKFRHWMSDPNCNKSQCTLCWHLIRPFVDTEVLECGHIYHRLCLKELFQLSISDEHNDVFCVQCKQQIDNKLIAEFNKRFTSSADISDGQQSSSKQMADDFEKLKV